MSRGFEGARIAVLYHGGYGETQKVAEAVARGVTSVAGVEALLIKVEDISVYWGVLEQVEGIIFGAPTYMGSASAEFKKFMDATSNRVFAKGYKWADKVAAGFTHVASDSRDELATLQQIAIFAAQHQMHWVSLGLPSGHVHCEWNEDTLNRHGFSLGATSLLNADQGAQRMCSDADLRTAEFLGARVAEVASQLAAGRAILEAFQTAASEFDQGV